MSSKQKTRKKGRKSAMRGRSELGLINNFGLSNLTEDTLIKDSRSALNALNQEAEARTSLVNTLPKLTKITIN